MKPRRRQRLIGLGSKLRPKRNRRAQAEQDQKLEAERRARAEAETAAAQAQARADAAIARLEADRAAELAARDRAAIQAEADRAREAAASRPNSGERQEAAAQAEQEKQELRQRLVQQLNLILQTRDSARGLIVNMSDVLFDTGKFTLKPGAREKLAKVAGIVLANPGLALQVEGHTDSVGPTTTTRNFPTAGDIGAGFPCSAGNRLGTRLRPREWAKPIL